VPCSPHAYLLLLSALVLYHGSHNDSCLAVVTAVRVQPHMRCCLGSLVSATLGSQWTSTGRCVVSPLPSQAIGFWPLLACGWMGLFLTDCFVFDESVLTDCLLIDRSLLDRLLVIDGSLLDRIALCLQTATVTARFIPSIAAQPLTGNPHLILT